MPIRNKAAINPVVNATREAMRGRNYDPHYASVEERLIEETILFVARYEAMQDYLMQQTTAGHINREKYRGTFPEIVAAYAAADRDPIPMILFCPACGAQHIDAAEPHESSCPAFQTILNPCECDRWTNPPHRSHLCHGCRHVWRPADVPTTGVAEIKTRGSKDTASPVASRPFDAAYKTYRHIKRGTTYIEIGRGELQTSVTHGIREGCRVVCYRSLEDGRYWFRPESEFDDSERFEKLW